MDEFAQASGLDERSAGEEKPFEPWLSVSDLMSGLLLFFALLFVTVMVQLKQSQNELARYRDEIKQYQEAFERLPLLVKEAIEDLGGEDSVSVDPVTGDVNLDDSIFFDRGSARLKEEGKEFLKEFIPPYSAVILSNETVRGQVARVVVEGRTSSGGDETYNLGLSLERALSVVEYILSDELEFPDKEQFKNKLLASGRGEIDANQTLDDPSDRRVVFRFQLKRQDMEKLLEDLEGLIEKRAEDFR